MDKKSLLYLVGGIVINIAGMIVSNREMEYNKKLAYKDGYDYGYQKGKDDGYALCAEEELND